MKLKKPKFWSYKKPNLFAILLYPLAICLQILSFIKSKINKKNKFKIKTVCFGNIYVGGTGKTSLCIKLNNILKEKNIRSCFIKKFYKNQKDEQKILEQNGKLFLSKNRAEAISNAEAENYEIAIFDDGLQDKTIDYDICFVCFNNINWIGNGMIMPSGPLRENIKKLKKYNHIFLNGNLENLDNLKKIIININSKINIHVGKYEPTNLNKFSKSDDYLVFSGIGNHKTFISMLKKHGLNILKDIEFPDHYSYGESDIKKIINEANKLNCKIITTEKDFLRLDKLDYDNIKYIKSELNILDEEKFLEAIL
tara:strand:+ start:3282 stop:4211 length:930 start_codon:yes stop_codon:yes gene_type:complete